MPAIEPAVPASGAVAGVGAWQVATIDSVKEETYRTKTFRVAVPAWRSFRPGQHVDVKLTAPDGYQAQRSYSIASAPETTGVLDLTVESVADGEVSSWFHATAAAGDSFELRGPIGGPFTWTVADGGPLLLVAGGSGVVPLMSMLRHRQAHDAALPALLLYSSRTIEDVIYREELDAMAAAPNGPLAWHTLTRSRPQGWSGLGRRVDRAMVDAAIAEVGAPRWVFVCGPTPFVESVAAAVIAAGVDPDRIRTERFGPSG
jgi:ferredoxin-NADP reductase